VDGFARRRRYQVIFDPINSRITTWLERNAARFGLGYADPWNDRRIVSFVLAVPQRVIHQGGDYKRLSHQAMYRVMPEKARRTAHKIYPSAFYYLAIREQACETVLGLITRSEAASRGYVNEDVLHRQYKAVRRGERKDEALWHMLTLEMWLRRYWLPSA
jgi:hypothetical protein